MTKNHDYNFELILIAGVTQNGVIGKDNQLPWKKLKGDLTKMATVYEIVQGIHQAAANAYDGAHDKKYSSDGEDHKVGLKREEGDPIVDSRVMDGFNVRVSGNTLMLSYQAEIKLKEFHDNSFEDDVESTLNDIVKFLKKEYKNWKMYLIKMGIS